MRVIGMIGIDCGYKLFDGVWSPNISRLDRPLSKVL